MNSYRQRVKRILLRDFLVFIVTSCVVPSSGTQISIATNSACNNNPLPSSVVVYNPMVNLTCCVEEFACPELIINWYRNGNDEEISHSEFLSVNLTEPQEMFMCVAEANNTVIPNPVCYENQYKGAVTIIQGGCIDEAPVKFIKTPASNSYALIGHNKVLIFQFKYTGHCIKPFVLVGSINLIDVHSINHTYHHTYPESGVEEYNITLLNVSHIYSNNYTVYASTNGILNKTADKRYSFSLWVCDKPQWYSNQSSVTHNSSTHMATLQYTFKACYSPDDELVRVHWKKNEQPLNISDERYNVSHTQQNKSLYIYTLMIHHTTINDSGNYYCYFRYKESKIGYSVMEKGIKYLNISGSTPSKSADSTDWQMLGGLIGGGVFLLIILAGLIVIFRYKPPDPGPDPQGEPLVQQVHELPDCENSQPVFTTPQQPESSRTYGESVELPNISLQVQSLAQLPRLPAPSLKPRTKVGQRLVYHRKDIVELLAGRDKSEVVADLKKGNMLRKDQLDHFFYLDEPLQAYTYLFDAVLTAGDVVIEKFHRYLLDSDVSDYFYTLVAPKVFLFYVMTTGRLEENIQQFANLLRQCGVNVICDFYEIEDNANFNGHLWVQQKINNCISSGGYVLVDVTNGPMNDLSYTQDENPTMNMRYTQFDSKTLYQNVIDSRECFIPFCLDNPPPSKVFPFQKDSVYHINITEFHQSFLEFKDTEYLDEFNVCESQAVQGFINKAADQFKSIVDLISRLTSQQYYVTE